ncbi:MAG: O-antigen ligase family protein, partial [Thermoanaerobaculia bacterium]
RWPEAALAAAVCALVAAPYLTVGLSFRAALYAQAGMLLAVVAGLACWGLTSGPGLAGWRQLPGPLQLALGLWAGAAIFGAAVGLARGSRPEAVLGQVLSLLLLPCGAFAASMVGGAELKAAFRRALVLAVSFAAAAQLLYWLATALLGSFTHRLFLANLVSVVSVCLAAVLLALAVPEGRRERPRVLWVLALLLLFVIGSGTRGLWLVLPPVLGLYWVASGEWRRIPRRAALAAALALTLLGGSYVLSLVPLHRSHPNLLPAEDLGRLFLKDVLDFEPRGRNQPEVPLAWSASEPPTRVFQDLPVTEPGTYRLQTEVEGGGDGLGTVTLSWHNQNGTLLAEAAVKTAASQAPVELEAITALRTGATGADLDLASLSATRGLWYLKRVRLERLGPPALASWLAQASYFDRRLHSLLAVVEHDPTRPQELSVAYRLAESRALWREFAGSGWDRKLLGRGLGATFVVPRRGLEWVSGIGEPVNYIHNFYLFLLFKLGLVGALAVLAALVLLVGAPLAWSRRVGPAERRFLVAAACVWLGYMAHSIASPELLNFRLAPILGLLAAVSWPAPARPEA